MRCFNYEELHSAVTETFNNRKTPMTMDTTAFSNEFLDDTMHHTRRNRIISSTIFWNIEHSIIFPSVFQLASLVRIIFLKDSSETRLLYISYCSRSLWNPGISVMICEWLIFVYHSVVLFSIPIRVCSGESTSVYFLFTTIKLSALIRRIR